MISQKIITMIIEYGILGLVVVCLGYYIVKLQKDHKNERSDWSKKSDATSKEMIKVVVDNTSAVSGLKATIDTFITYNHNNNR